MAEGRKRYRDKLKSRYKTAKRLSIAGSAVGGLSGKIIVFLVAFGIPIAFTLFMSVALILVFSGGMMAIYDLDPSLKTSVPKSAETADKDSGGSKGRDLNVPAAVKGKFLFPTGTMITSPQGPRDLAGYKYHDGLDIAGKFGSENANYIYPVYPGKVIYSNPNSGPFGKAVVVKHDVDGTVLFSMYAHMSDLKVKVGDEVGFKDKLGIMGATGNVTGVHLHLEIHDKNFKYYNRSTSLKVADYLTCSDKKGSIANAVQSTTECMNYRKKVTGSGG